MKAVGRIFVLRALKLLNCGFLIVAFHDNSISQVEGGTAHKSGGNVIRIWTVGSPYTDTLPTVAVPPELQRRAESLGYTIEMQAFRPIGFANKFRQALREHNEPEVLTFNNYAVLSGMNTQNGVVEGIASDIQTASLLFLVRESLSSNQERGWVVLVCSAFNYGAAKALSMQPLSCETQSSSAVGSETTLRALRQAEETAMYAARAYMACDQSTLSVISDESRLGQKCFLPDSETQVESVKACQVSGNRNLAVVVLVTTFSSQVRIASSDPELVQGGNLGQQSILAVLRNNAGVWRLLAISVDPVNTLAMARQTVTTPKSGPSLDEGLAAGITPDPARLLIQDGMYPQPPKGERFGDFVWELSQSKDVIGQVVEFMFDRYSNRRGTRLFFLGADARKISSGLLVSGGPTLWRVWSISKNGDVGFSEQRSFTH